MLDPALKQVIVNLDSSAVHTYVHTIFKKGFVRSMFFAI